MKRIGEFFKKIFERTRYALKRVFGWIKRSFLGLQSDKKQREDAPWKLRFRAFFAKKTSVVALISLLLLIAFVFIAPLVTPMEENYTDPLQQNVAPSYSMRSVPTKLKKKVQSINGFSDFTVGLSTDGKIYVWGNTENRVLKIDMKKLPARLRTEKTAFLAAGKDHAIAVTTGGEVIGWGDKSCGQYGGEQVLNAIPMPTELIGGVDAANVKQLVCGYQTSALIMQDGKGYFWGNTNTARNLSRFQSLTDVEQAAFTNSAAVALRKNGELFLGGEELFTFAVSSINGEIDDFNSYMVGRKAVEIATTNKCLALLTADGELIVAGIFENGEDVLPALRAGERFVSLDGGTRHFIGVTDQGRVYGWGHNAYGQCNLSVRGADKVFAGALQSYAVGGEKLLKSAGLKGYLMGTDGRGRDVFTRIAHGGKTTVTVGGVAVLVSTVIAVIVGSLAGYFGGAVDTFLMRITEIFSSVPFLPFAMLLSQIIKNYNFSETARIVIIMFILGILSWPSLARMIRAQVLVEREKEFVLAAKAIGAKEGRIAFRHILPNVLSVILVSTTLNFASCLLTESSLSYLGFGVQPPRPTWGNMLTGSNNGTIIRSYWWQWLFPALFLSIAVVCINVVGDGLRDAFDPKSDTEK